MSIINNIYESWKKQLSVRNEGRWKEMTSFSCKLTAILLSIAMLIALVPVAVFAANNITLNKSVYSINEPMNVKVTGLTQEQTDSRTYVSIYKSGARPD